MKNLVPKGLTRKFFILGLFLILLPITFVFIFAVNVSQSYLTERTHHQLNQESLYMAKQTNQMFQDKTSRMENASKYFRESENREALESLVRELHVNDPFYLSTYLIDEQGTVEYSSEGIEVTEMQNQILENVITEMEWRRSSFVYSSMRNTENPAELYLAVPLHEDDHMPVDGAIVAKVSSSYIHNFFRAYANEEVGRVLLLDSKGVVFLDSLHTYLSENLQDEEFFRDVKKERPEVLDMTWRDDEVLISHHAVDRLPLYTIIITDKNYAYASTEGLMGVLSFGWIILFGSGIAMIIITRKKMVDPIKDLTEQSYKYADNEKWRTNLIVEKDEIKTLSKSMHYMAEDLKAKERYLKLILESFPYGVITINEDETITSINKTGENLIKLNKNQFIGKPYRKLPLKKLVQLFDYHFKKQQLNETITDQIKFVDRNGKTKHMKISISPLLNESDTLIGQLITLWDYTTIKELESHLQRSEHLAAIGQMTAGLAHEVKNPLGTIQMAADVVQEEVREISITDKENLSRFSMVHEALEDIQDETKRLNNLVNKFLQVSKNKKSEEKLLRLSTINDKVLQLLSHQFKYFGIQLSVEQFTDKDIVEGDESQLIQSFMNIYLNAIEAMQDKGGKIRVSIQLFGDELVVAISDNGVGIAQSKMKRIFNPFFSNKQEGTGLGLSITHDIIKEHGGRIDVASELKIGTTFKIHLPKV